MEYNWSLFNHSNGTSIGTTAYNHTNGQHTWETSWDSNNNNNNNGGGLISRPDNWSYPLHYSSLNYYAPPISGSSGGGAARQVQACACDHPAAAMMMQEQEKISTCLKLGKRHYFEDVMEVPPPPAAMKRGKPYFAAAAAEAAQTAAVARCQVEGCGVALVNAKEYHRRHKVCEVHAKAPKVVVLGIEQRFCQQCSRFHVVAEFDQAKRSCRRRLAGHNERRRKSTTLDSHGVRRESHSAINRGGECALSLLSSTNYSASWNNIATSAAYLPERCGAALRELIAENRASILACKKNLFTNSNNYQMAVCYNKLNGSTIRAGSNPHENGAGHVTLDLMRARNSALGFLPSKESGEQDCSELWKVPMGY